MIELEQKHTWQYNPLLYLKIAFIGLDHALTKPAADDGERIQRALSRLAAIPGLLNQATKNISSIPETYYQASRLMLADCRQYLAQIGSDLLARTGKSSERLSTCLANALAALKAMDGFLTAVSVKPDGQFATDTLSSTLKDHLLSVRSLKDINRMAVEDWEINLDRSERLKYKMLTAHETIPGHHFLVSIRRRLANPVRRQIESPLFYEGWASYAELLLIDFGYVHTPMDLMVDIKRRLWRSARCQVDVGLTTDRIKAEDAVHLLTVCGFSVEEAQRQIDRFRLNPGYQLCYSLGCHELKHLKTSCGSHMKETEFHTYLLEGGELPFHLIKKRFDNYSAPEK